MITCPEVQKRQIRTHYDLTTLFYRLLWGTHIHHGLWKGNESASVAQLNLVRALLHAAQIPRGAAVLDVGCGMGASSIYLARRHHCRVTGITISPLQRRWAQLASRASGIAGRTSFLCQDVEEADFPPGSYDAIWSIECTEHLFEKERFFQRVASWLRPGGRVAICAWLAEQEPLSDPQRSLVRDVCQGFFCPSLGTRQDYVQWLESSGLAVQHFADWTDRVLQTWVICQRRVQASGMPWLARLLSQDTVLFLQRFQAILDAYRQGAMRYGCFVASAG